jgi:hypothetical protein
MILRNALKNGVSARFNFKTTDSKLPVIALLLYPLSPIFFLT